MPKQKPQTAKELVSLAKKRGFIFARQRGSHMIFYNEKGIRMTIPDHGSKKLHPKIIKNILRDINRCDLN